MKIRIKFTKSGPLKFIGHLDVMRYFQKAFRRAEIEVEYSKGYSPHQLMSFAAPLGVGLTSESEYLDVSMNFIDTPETMIQKINKVMNENIQIIGFYLLPDNSKNAMSIVCAADYLVSVKDGYDFMEKEEFEQKFLDFSKQESIVIIKKSKKSENEVDIKPMIYQVAFDEPSKSSENRGQALDDTMPVSNTAQVYENGTKVYMQLATGSVNNLKPELVMEAFCAYAGIGFNEFVYQVHRREVYTGQVEGDNKELIPLERVELN